MRITPILAESQRAFNDYIREHNLNTRHFSYIRNEWNLRGYCGLVITVGRWWRNERYRTLDFHDAIHPMVYSGQVSIIQGTWDSETSQEKITLL